MLNDKYSTHHSVREKRCSTVLIMHKGKGSVSGRSEMRSEIQQRASTRYFLLTGIYLQSDLPFRWIRDRCKRTGYFAEERELKNSQAL